MIIADFDYDKESLLLKADKSRERNRDHSRKSRLRKKAFVECLKTEVRYEYLHIYVDKYSHIYICAQVKQLQQYKEVCEHNPDIVLLLSGHVERKILFCTSALTRLLGYPEEKILSEAPSFYTWLSTVRHTHDLSRSRQDGEVYPPSSFKNVEVYPPPPSSFKKVLFDSVFSNTFCMACIFVIVYIYIYIYIYLHDICINILYISFVCHVSTKKLPRRCIRYHAMVMS